MGNQVQVVKSNLENRISWNSLANVFASNITNQQNIFTIAQMLNVSGNTFNCPGGANLSFNNGAKVLYDTSQVVDNANMVNLQNELRNAIRDQLDSIVRVRTEDLAGLIPGFTLNVTQQELLNRINSAIEQNVTVQSITNALLSVNIDQVNNVLNNTINGGVCNITAGNQIQFELAAQQLVSNVLETVINNSVNNAVQRQTTVETNVERTGLASLQWWAILIIIIIGIIIVIAIGILIWYIITRVSKPKIVDVSPTASVAAPSLSAATIPMSSVMVNVPAQTTYVPIQIGMNK